ncbi:MULTISPECIES: polysaccharide pyruvyl transferase family protein [Algibacter]|uniref:Colanic acid/amylovoran biosynthesis protein n=2 Tax=Algibacter TaxID=261827 RepID=A0A4R8M9Z2_9FLAO|nr:MULTISPECIES: polysaccharide pyruvyl transferase family protein [Algibacter]MDN3664922.1 polysaccharide pyruvyl transferase family protein [Algibacter miyuki]MWW24424.1 hypothetical protein [Algibacter lectus]TDY62443.1 colanic acid/amylovoran biosynthesis protein [Algibacter lectus]
MVIQIDGTNTLNKGAELMLVALLEQIEKHHPEATVYYNTNNIGEKSQKFSTNLAIHQRFWLRNSKYPVGVLRRLKLPYTFFTSKHPVKGVNLLLDAAGFQFSDQWNYTKERLDELENYYKKLKSKGTKIIFLPQAFGPFKTNEGKRAVEIINKYADIIFAREEISYNFILEAGADKDKVQLCTDFTLLVKGVLPKLDIQLKDKVCIIPNKKMITHANSSKNEYLSVMGDLISIIRESGREPFLLNHEGIGDLEICNLISKNSNKPLDILNGFNAKEVKGIIGSSYMVISSRFHGVASALNQGVPCLSTSWNHKYEMLFNDFGLSKDYIIGLKPEIGELNKVVKTLLDKTENEIVRDKLKESRVKIDKKVNEMWNLIWNKNI